MRGLSYPSHSKRRGALSFYFTGAFLIGGPVRNRDREKSGETGSCEPELQAGRLRAYNKNAPEKEALAEFPTKPQTLKPQNYKRGVSI